MNTEIQTYLPIFSGFYGSIFESALWDYEEEDYEYFDNEAYRKDIVQAFCEFITTNCPFITSVVLEKIVSPKFYNFSNDSANVTIDLNVSDLRDYLFQNEVALKEYIKDNYTSCDGFVSYYSSDYLGWGKETKDFTELDINHHYLGALLDFYFSNEKITEEDVYEFYITDYDRYF